jgi:hypothetical protein
MLTAAARSRSVRELHRPGGDPSRDPSGDRSDAAPTPAGKQTVALGGIARARPSATLVRLAPGRHRINLGQIAQKRLPPGTYVLTAKAVNSAGQASSVEYAKFWVFS